MNLQVISPPEGSRSQPHCQFVFTVLSISVTLHDQPAVLNAQLSEFIPRLNPFNIFLGARISYEDFKSHLIIDIRLISVPKSFSITAIHVEVSRVALEHCEVLTASENV
jgi:hypothetical protein